MIGLQPLQRALAGSDGAAPRGVARQHLGDEEEFFARQVGDGVRDHELSVAIHLGGVDMRHAGFDAPAQRGDGGLAVAAIEIPGALPDHGYGRAMRAEFFLFQDHLNF